MNVTLGKGQATKTTGTGPGAISGQPAIAFLVTFTNSGTQAVSLDSAVVSATYGAAATPATSDDGGTMNQPIAGGMLAPGSSQSGTYVFAVPVNQDGNVTVSISLNTPSQVIVQFTGAVN